ncbi:MAG: hypothetical protein ETSY1_05840 [Candidatus Entotheonella factor]|uniref:Uncharacterized protein n=2 Tax=Candidatus Entotheonella TaxID=93171 RepID=W4LVS9_ENTF1|nr:MAG: hypothetical protein ETSY1_05840 [Candidatus Entotheonella factor]
MRWASPRPLCPIPERDVWLRQKVEHSVDLLRHAVEPKALEAVILTGSTARGEASVLPVPRGFRLLGDLEFIVIVRAPFDWPRLRRQMAALSERATQEVGAAGREAVIEYGPAGRVYLQRNIRPCIFAYDLRTHGQVVWGQPDILSDITPFEVDDIPPEDALNLLMNRLIECLLLERRAAPHHDGYRTVKWILEAAGSALACARSHVPCYRERGKAFDALLQTEPELTCALSDLDAFRSWLEAAIACKLEPSVQRLTDLQQALSFSQCVRWGHELWLWQVHRWLGGTPHVHDALELYMRRESTGLRLKGWAKFFRHPLRPPGTLSWPRLARLLLQSSPQTLTYATALLLLAGLTGAGGPDWQQQICRLSPVRLEALDAASLADAIGELWIWLIRNN